MIKKLTQAIIFILLYSACANITTPNGGPKDIAPPKLVASLPLNKQKNFDGKTVSLTFDEVIKLNNPKEEITISPSPGDDVDFKFKKNTVLITPKSGWKPETTYSIQFREGVKDMSEGNVPLNLKLAFSTGPNIDSLRFSGLVTDLLKGTTADKITVAIYQSDTVDIFTDKPEYFTRTDKAGKFILDNIKVGDYIIYAWDDKNKNLKVESKSERYGFIGPKLRLEENIDTIAIGLIMLDSRPLKISSIRNVGNVTRLRFSKYLTDYTIESDSALTNNFGDNQTELTIWNPISNDSVMVHLTATDSLELKVDSSFYIKKTNIKPIIDKLAWSLGQPKVQSETGKFETTLKFNKPITYINFDSLSITMDTVKTQKTEVKVTLKKDEKKIEPEKQLVYIPITKENITLDTKRKEIIIKKTLDKALFQGDVDPIFMLKTGRGFFYTIDNDTSKALSTSIPIIWPEDSGTIAIETKTTKPHYIIELMTSEYKIAASGKDLIKYTFRNIQPGDYRLRIIIDSNGNGQWDPGNIVKRIEPEKVIYYKGSNKKPDFTIRANWEIGPLILKF